MADTWEPWDLFGDPQASDPLALTDAEAPGSSPTEVEWLAGTSWRDALDLPLDIDHPDHFGSDPADDAPDQEVDR